MNSQNDKLISVIIPVYNVEQYILRCLDSLNKQTYSNVEIILVDDGSTDSSGMICDEYRGSHDNVVVIHKKNGGLSDARNKGLTIAKGEYICFVDSDDYVDEDYIEYLYNLVKKYNTDMAICQHRVIKQSGKIIDYGRKGDDAISREQCLERMLYFDVIDTSAWSKLYKTSLFEDIEYPQGEIFEDLLTTYKLFFRCEKIACGYESKYNYEIRDNSISTAPFSERKINYMYFTDFVADEIVSRYPQMKDAAMARCVRARISVINFLNNEQTEKYKYVDDECKAYIKKHALKIFLDNRVSTSEKTAVGVICISVSLYRFLAKMCR